MAWEHTEDVYKSGVKALLTSTQFSVLLYIAHRVHPRQHYAWPRRSEICAELDSSKSSVDDAISSLSRLGFLRTHRRGFDRLNFSIPSIEELSVALSVAKTYLRRARAEHGIMPLRDAQRWALRQMEHEIRPMLIGAGQIAPGRNVGAGQIAPGRNLDTARAQSLLWTKEKEKKKGEVKEKIPDLLPSKEKKEGPTENYHQLWRQCLHQLALQLPETTFETWVRDTRLEAEDDGEYIVSAPHAFACNWLTNRLTEKVTPILNRIASRTTKIRFIVRGETAAAVFNTLEISAKEESFT